jgi:hypothetical protein
VTTTANGSANGDARSREREEWLVANYLTARADLFRRFSGIVDQRRDYLRECHWPLPPFPPELLQAVYEHDPLGYRVVTIRPEACWQSKLSVYDSERSDTGTDFEAGLVECGRNLEGEPSYLEDDELPWLRSLLRRADELAGVARYGVVVLGTDDGLPPDQPARGFEEVNSAPAGRRDDGSTYLGNATGPYRLAVNAKAAKGTKLVSAQPFPEYLAPIASFENNPTSPRYCRPTSYSVTFADPNAAGTTQSRQGTVGVTRTVHWSRVVHVALGRRSSPTFCPPRLDPVLYPVLDARKIRGAGAEGYWQQAFALLFLMTDPALGGDVHVSDEAKQALKDMLENIRNGLQRDGLLKGFSPQTVAPAVADPTGQYGLQIDTICVGIDVPKRIFEGSERGELASSQDTRDWLASVRLRNNGELTPCLVGPVVSRLVSLGCVPLPRKGFRADWEDVSTQTDQEKAAVFLTRVQAYGAYVAGGVEALFTPLDAMTRLDAMTQDEAQAVIDAHAEDADDALTLPPPGEPGHPATPKTPPRPAGQAPDDTPALPAANTFCPTGEGGGVDPSCSPGGGPAGVSAAAGRLHAYLAGAGGEHTLTSLAGALRTKPGKLAPALDELLRGGHAEEAGVRGAETAYRARAAPDAIPHTPEAVGAAATLAADRVPYLAGTRVGANKAFVSDVYDHLAPRLGGMTLGAFKSQLLAALAAGHVRLTRADLPQLMPRDKVARSETAHRVGGYHAADYHFVTGRAPAANYDPDQPRVPAGSPGGGQFGGGGGGGAASGPRATGGQRAAYHGPEAPAPGWARVGTDAHGNGVWQAPAAKQGLLGKLFGGGRQAEQGPTGHTTAETLKERAAASKEYQAQAAKVAAKNDPVYADLAGKAGMTPDEYKAQVAGKLQALADGQHVYVRTRPETLEKILAGGRVLTQHETGKSGGGVTAVDMRKDVEARGMGVPKDAPAQVRPVSAYLGRKDFATTRDDDRTVTGYGNVVMRLKDSVRDRGTVTHGDSLSEISQGNLVASPLRAVGHESLSAHELAYHGDKVLDSPQAFRVAKPFAEVQVHDGLNVSDVHEIGFQAEPPAHVRDALASKGIPWRVYNGPTGNAGLARNQGVPRMDATGKIYKGDGDVFIVTTGHRAGLDYGVLVDVAAGEVYPEQPVLTYMRMSGGSGWDEFGGDRAPILALVRGATP